MILDYNANVIHLGVFLLLATVLETVPAVFKMAQGDEQDSNCIAAIDAFTAIDELVDADRQSQGRH